jgi:hypothetical protein
MAYDKLEQLLIVYCNKSYVNVISVKIPCFMVFIAFFFIFWQSTLLLEPLASFVLTFMM